MWARTVAPPASRLVGQRFEVADRVGGGREPPADELVELVLGLLGQHEHRRQDAGLAERHALLHQGDAQALGARLERGSGHRGGAVAVAVGLHHHPEGGRRHGLGQHAHVRGDGTQVHLHPGACRRGSASGAVTATPARPAAAPADPRRPGPGPGPLGRAAVQPGCSRGGPEGRHLLGQQGGDDPGQHVPGPRRGQPLVAGGRDEHGARRFGHDRRRSLQQDDRTRCRRQLAPRPGGPDLGLRPASNPYSPS